MMISQKMADAIIDQVNFEFYSYCPKSDATSPF